MASTLLVLTMSLAARLLEAAPLAEPAPLAAHIQTSRSIRLPGKADLMVWRRLASDRLVYGKKGHALFVRPQTERARLILHYMGVEAELGSWQPVVWDDSKLVTAMDAGLGLELRSAPAYHPLLDRSLPEIGVDLVQSGRGVDVRRDGRGVLVGIIDTGIDLGHPAFRDAQGRSRVVAVWDQDGAGEGPEKFGYGYLCSRESLRADACTIDDPVGHGTHVAGIAVGSGIVGGVAPLADIAVVRSNDFTRLADAVDFLIDLADDRDEPLVINISVGGQYGPHDGRTPLELYLNKRLGPGRLVVAAAGNDGNGHRHIGTGLADSPVRVALQLPTSTTSESLVELWSRPEAKVSVALELWVGEALLATEELPVDDSEIINGSVDYGGSDIVGFDYGVELLDDHGLARRSLVLTQRESLPSGGTLALRLSGTGRVDGWISQSSYHGGSASFGERREAGWLAGDGEYSLTVPAMSPKVLAVGAYTVRDAWTSEAGRTVTISDQPFGSLAAYSSLGPTLAPDLTGPKPDLVAPGSVIISARALVIPDGSNTLDAEHVAMQGTSMAAPHVTGVLALMLEADHELGPHRARAILQETARADGQTGEVPNAAWGYGKIDAQAAVAIAERPRGGCAAAPAGLAGALAALLLLRRRR